MKHLKMNHKIFFVVVISLLFTFPVFAHELDMKIPVYRLVSYYATAVGEEESVIPHGIANNQFYLESLRLSRLAIETFEFGDYEASAGFAQEAILFAQLSDEYVAGQLIIEAKRLMDWADNNNIAARFPNNYEEGKNQYETAVIAYSEEEWNNAIEAAVNAIEIFGAFQATGRPATATATTRTPSEGTPSNLARQYTVRTWRVERDCLWNIAGYPWVFGDPWRWRELYEANRANMPEPDNPDLIHPGMVLEIPR
jgi:hypothetical protein